MTRFRKILTLLNEMKRKRIIDNYAIGGGVAAYRYTRMPTKDLDVFIIIEVTGPIIHLSPIYNFLKSRGYSKWSGQFLVMEGYPVDFITAKGLEAEAVENALTVSYQGTRARVMKPEYLIAISLRAGRPRDKDRVRSLLLEANINDRLLKDILKRYKLTRKLDEIKRYY